VAALAGIAKAAVAPVAIRAASSGPVSFRMKRMVSLS
jgi:hypothetical protein